MTKIKEIQKELSSGQLSKQQFLPEMGKPAARNFSLSSTTVQRERSSTDDIFTMERGQCAAPCRRAAAEASPNARSIVKSPI